MKKKIEKYRVYIEDTDMMGIVYHSNYLNYCERARTEFLRSLGFSLTNMSKDDTYFAVKHLHIDFKAPAILDDMLSVETDVTVTGFCQLRFKQDIYNQHQKILSHLVVDVVCVNGKMSPKRLPKQLSKEFLA
jgi:acyl-CoA thioester hydrolase